MAPRCSDNPTERAWDAFVEFLRTHGSRVTDARRMVLEQAMARKDHFRADDLAADLSAGPSRVSRGTIYRTLALMVEAGLVREIRDTDVHAHYEWVFGRPEHEHMVCDVCGKFIEFSDPRICSAIRDACREQSFDCRSYRVMVFGICPSCRDEKTG
ncbi:MAG: Fur family transcriptional regulator [Phycisphaerae bacterium]